MSEFLRNTELIQNVIAFAFALPFAIVVYKGEEIPKGQTKDVVLPHDTNPNHRTIYRFLSNRLNHHGSVTVWLEENDLFGWTRKGREHRQNIKAGGDPFTLGDGSQAQAIKK